MTPRDGYTSLRVGGMFACGARRGLEGARRRGDEREEDESASRPFLHEQFGRGAVILKRPLESMDPSVHAGAPPVQPAGRCVELPAGALGLVFEKGSTTVYVVKPTSAVNDAIRPGDRVVAFAGGPGVAVVDTRAMADVELVALLTARADAPGRRVWVLPAEAVAEASRFGWQGNYGCCVSKEEGERRRQKAIHQAIQKEIAFCRRVAELQLYPDDTVRDAKEGEREGERARRGGARARRGGARAPARATLSLSL